MDSDKRNLILALLLSVFIALGWSYFFPPKSQQARPQTDLAQVQQTVPPENLIHNNTVLSRSDALKTSHRIQIIAPRMTGSIDLKGARFDDITLTQYTQDPDSNSPHVNLLTPVTTSDPYIIDTGWISSDKALTLPNKETVWTTKDTQLTPDHPITLSWDNGQGLIFHKEIHVDNQYLLTVQQSVTNASDKNVTVATYGFIYRSLPDSVSDYFILHEGPIGYLNNKLVETKFKDLKDKSSEKYNSVGGWTGFTDKYWLTALIPDQSQNIEVNYRYTPQNSQECYQIDYTTQMQTLEPAQSVKTECHLFTGAKELSVLDGYEEKLKVKHFDLAVDFGWYYIITKPIFYILTYAKAWLGNFGLAIMLLTVILKILFFPLANKSYRSMAKMKTLQPKLEKIKQLYASDRARMNQEMIELYRREKVNPMAGCLPMIVQIPVFFALYKVLFITIEMRHAPFFGWIHDLSAPDPTSLFNLFGLIVWTPPSFLMLGIWPLIMGATMFAQQKLNPAPADPAQAKLFMLMPLIFTFMFAQFPAGLVIYWAWNNVLSILQQWSIMRLSNSNTHLKPKSS